MRLHWLLPSISGIPVLMYHRIWPGISDGLTITPEKLKEQWAYLKNEGYQTLDLNEFLQIAKEGKQYPEKSILISFDDGYKNNLQYVYPLLKEMSWQAVFFIICDTLDNTATKENDPVNAKMNIEELKQLDPSIVQLALHGYHHEDFTNAGVDELSGIIQSSVKAFENSGLVFHKVLAYPYGARPKNKSSFKTFKNWMLKNGIEAAFRIGNKPCKVPANDIYEIKRIDIKGTDSIEDLKIKLKKGKLKPF